MDPSGNIQPSNNKLLENMSTLLHYIENSRKDLLDATKSVSSAYKNEYEQNRVLEDEMDKLRAYNGNLEMVRDKLENDLLRLREAYNKELIRNEELTEAVKALQGKLKKLDNIEVPSVQPEEQQQEKAQLDKVNEDATPPTNITGISTSETFAEQRSSNFVSPEFISSEPYSSTGATSTSNRRLKSSTLYSLPKQSSNSDVMAPRKSRSGVASKHKFVETSKLRFQTCQHCKCSIMPMAKYYQCYKCNLKIDRSCSKSNLLADCVPQNIIALSELIPSDSEQAVPEILLKCCEQIEVRGTNNDILYEQKNEQEASKLFDKYMSNKNVTQLKLHKVDTTILSDLVLKVLASVEEPLIGGKTFQDFARASDQKCSDERAKLMRQLLSQLPKPQRHTLAFLLLHLKQISSKNFNNRLNNLTVASLFGPIIASNETYKLRSEPKKSLTTQDQIKRTQLQKQVLLSLLDLSPEYCKEALQDQNESVPHLPNRRTTNYQVMLMNNQQRQSFYDNLSNAMY